MPRPLMLAAVLAVLAASADARPPPNPDPTLAPWFESLRQPKTGASCCGISDCRPADYRTSGDHYEVFLENRWIEVPQHTILHRLDNPTGRGIVCYTPVIGIMCFVPGPET